MNRVKACLVLGVAVFLFAAGCISSEAAEVLRVGIIPSEDQREMLKRYGELLDYLEESLGMEIKPFVATDYSGVIEAMRSGKLDIAYFGPFSYVLAADVANAECFAVPIRSDGRTTYNSIIVTHVESGIKSISDLRGRTFAFVDPASTSGHLFPRAILQKAGIDPEKDFSSMVFAGGHDAVELAVKNRKVDAGADSDKTYERMVKNGLIDPKVNIIIAKSDPIPGSPWAWRRDLPNELKNKAKAAILEVSEKRPEILAKMSGGMKGYAEAKDADYDVIREMAKILNLDLKSIN